MVSAKRFSENFRKKRQLEPSLFVISSRERDLTVECCICRLAIGPQDKVAEPKRQRAEQRPADKAELQAEKPPAVARHHRLRGPQHLARLHLRVLSQNVIRHPVGIAHNDTRHNEQQRPHKDVHALPKPRQRHCLPLRKIGKQHLEPRLRPIDKVEVILRVPRAHNAAEDEVRHSQHERDHGKIDRTADEQPAPLRAKALTC